MGFDVVVRVTADTEVEFHGDEAELSDIKVGDFVKVSGFFMNSGITANEIDIVDRGDGEFRVRGLITAVRPVANGTLITVLGIDVLVNSDTKVERPRGSTAGFTAADLAVNQNVDTRGFHRDSQFVATRVKVGNRDEDAIRVHFEGKITAVAPGRLAVDTEGGSTAIVLITSTTIVTGTPEVGKFVEVHGTLNSSLAVVATRIKVKTTRDDDDPPRPISKFEKKVSILPIGVVSSVRGEAEVQLEQKGSAVEQELEIEFKHAQANTDYIIRIEVAGIGGISLGTVRTNREGQAEMKLRSPARSGQPDLAAILPSGKTVRDITRVQIMTTGGVVVAEGTF